MTTLDPASRLRPVPPRAKGWAPRVLAFSIAVLSIILSVEGDVFPQHGNLPSSLWKSIKDSLQSTERPLSTLMQRKRGPQEVRTPQLRPAREVEQGPLYVFAIDVSGSLKERPVSEREADRYRELILQTKGGQEALGCLPEENSVYNSFDIAVAELCRYFTSVLVPSRAALWIFGTKATQVVPRWSDEDGKPRFLSIGETSDGNNPMHKFFTWAEHREETPEEDWTDLEGLFEKLYVSYQDEIQGGDEVHFIIVSDFIHDVDGKIGGSARREIIPESHEWEGYYLVSRSVIGSHVEKMVRHGSTFHLAIIRGASSSLRNILPVLRTQSDWGDLRETNLGSGQQVAAFDFLRSYENAPPLEFGFTSERTKPLPIRIKFDEEKYEGSYLRLGLATDPLTEEGPPLRLRLSAARQGWHTANHYHGTLKGDDGEYIRVMLRGGEDGDVVEIEPSAVLSPRQAAGYRLLVSWDDREDDNRDPSVRRTYSIPIEFRRDLSSLSAWTLMILMSLVALSTFAVLIAQLKRYFGGLFLKTLRFSVARAEKTGRWLGTGWIRLRGRDSGTPTA